MADRDVVGGRPQLRRARQASQPTELVADQTL
jgi:hypothetical protein